MGEPNEEEEPGATAKKPKRGGGLNPGNPSPTMVYFFIYATKAYSYTFPNTIPMEDLELASCVALEVYLEKLGTW